MAKDLLEHIDFSGLECLNASPANGVDKALKQGYREQVGRPRALREGLHRGVNVGDGALPSAVQPGPRTQYPAISFKCADSTRYGPKPQAKERLEGP